MTLTESMQRLSPGAAVTYIGQEGNRWWCELRLPKERYTATLVTADGATPDDALRNAVTRARTVFVKAQEGEEAA